MSCVPLKTPQAAVRILGLLRVPGEFCVRLFVTFFLLKCLGHGSQGVFCGVSSGVPSQASYVLVEQKGTTA